MLRDSLLAWAHFITIFALVSTVVAELVLYRRQMDVVRLTQLQGIDRAYGIAAGLVIVTGVSRVIWGLKGAGFYLSDPFFWTKMALFVIVGLLSIPPTIHYLRVKNTAGADGAVAVPEAAFQTMRRLLGAELVLLACIPFLAAMLAHGYH